MKKFNTRTLFLLLVCVAFIASQGCRTAKVTTRETHDTVFVSKTITVTDTVFKTEATQVSEWLPIDSLLKPDLNPVTKQFKNARLTITRYAGGIKADCDCDTLAIKAQLIHTQEKEYRARSQTETKTITIRERYVPGFIKFLAWSGGIFWLALIAYFTFKKLFK
ncbi:MAG: hypothetical protein K1X81_01900 [Bacteroidia bacterium]|nr:hypothetical protein [Bacteroidia bacterium]